MAIESDELLQKIADMLNVVQLHCNDCKTEYLGSAKYNEKTGKPHVLGVCPFCGSRKVDVARSEK